MSKPVNPAPANWIAQYQDWHGTLPDLVSTANTILADQFPGVPIEPVTLRTARHYQAKGAVSRGDKQGRSATFGVDDLMRLVSTKKLVTDGLPINYTSSLVTSSPAAHVAQALAPSGTKATAVVANMMSQLGHSEPSTLRAFAGTATASFNASATPVAAPDPWRQHTARTFSQSLDPQDLPLSPVAWMQLSVDEAALKRASVDERARAAHALLGLASRLTAPTGDQ